MCVTRVIVMTASRVRSSGDLDVERTRLGLFRMSRPGDGERSSPCQAPYRVVNASAGPGGRFDAPGYGVGGFVVGSGAEDELMRISFQET